jgi:hypothetical protein
VIAVGVDPEVHVLEHGVQRERISSAPPTTGGDCLMHDPG